MLASRAEYSVLEFGSTPFGILLRDPVSDRLYQRFRSDLESDPADREVLELLPDDIEAKAREIGAGSLLELFEDTLSNTLQIRDRRSVIVRDFEGALDRIFEQEVLGVRPIRGAAVGVPLYGLRAAAGRFGEDMEVEPEGFVNAPAGVRITTDLYAVHVTGHSMEPEIPDGAIALFRYCPAGSRQGKHVLVWRRAASQSGGEFTVKVYESEKRVIPEGWQHTSIRLKPLNPEYPVLELEDDTEYRVLGELVALPGIDEL